MSVDKEIESEYNLYMVLENLGAEIGDAAPWFSSLKTMRQDQLRGNAYVDKIEGGQMAYENSCSTLLKEGYLLKIVSFDREKQVENQILYGRDN